MVFIKRLLFPRCALFCFLLTYTKSENCLNGIPDSIMNRYCILTNDTEALPNRATEDHVNRLMLGKFNEGKAGVQEMAEIAREFNGKITFFVDLCGAYDRKDEILDVVKWLDTHGQDVELHLHPEYLPDEFWEKNGFSTNPRFLNTYQENDKDKLRFIFNTFAGELESVINRKINAYRAGSFRWNNLSMDILKEMGIPMSFNNTVASRVLGQCPYAIPYQKPFRWSNGIIEVPVTEKNFFSRFRDNWWVRFQYPLCSLVRYRSSLGSLIPYSVSPKDEFVVCLMHSWSFLERDKDGYQYYKDDRLQEEFRSMLKKMSRDFDIIDSRDLKYLIDSGKFPVDHTEDLSKAVYVMDNIISMDNLSENNKITSLTDKEKDDSELSPTVYHDGRMDERRIQRGKEYLFSAEFLYKYLEKDEQLKKCLKFEHTKQGILIKSTSEIEDHLYIPFSSRFSIKDFKCRERLPLYMGCDSDAEMDFGIYFYDEHGTKLSSRLLRCNRNLFLNIQKDACFVTISFRIPSGFKSAVIRFLAFSFIDGISTHVYRLPENLLEMASKTKQKKDNGAELLSEEKTPGEIRFTVKNSDKRQNGVIIALPSLETVTVDNAKNYPYYANRLLKDIMPDYMMIFVSEPVFGNDIFKNLTCFMSGDKDSLISFISEKIKEIIGEDHGKVLCCGMRNGGFVALNFAANFGADCCICSSLKYNSKIFSSLTDLTVPLSSENGLKDVEFMSFSDNVYKGITRLEKHPDLKVRYNVNTLTKKSKGCDTIAVIVQNEKQYIGKCFGKN